MTKDCPECGSMQLRKVSVQERIGYGAKPNTVYALLNVPHTVCDQCGFSFLDWEDQKERDRILKERFEC